MKSAGQPLHINRVCIRRHETAVRFFDLTAERGETLTLRKHAAARSFLSFAWLRRWLERSVARRTEIV